MSKETKDRLLRVHSSGLYNNLSPEQALSLYHENKNFLNIATLNLLLAQDSQKDIYDLTELQFYLALITKNDTEAKMMLGRLTDKFGGYKKSQRIAVLRSVYIEATGSQPKNYQEASKFLESVPQFGKKINVIRRRTYLASKLNNIDANEYIKGLTSYLEVKPSDNESWYELSEVYLKLGNYTKSIYCLEQILLCVPFAYNIYYKLGAVYQSYAYKILYDFSDSNNANKRENFNYNQATIDKFFNFFNLSLKHFLKSVELCESYYKGWSGIFILTKPLKFKNKNLVSKFSEKNEQYSKLNILASQKLKEIIKKNWTSEENKKLIEKVLTSE